MCGYYGATSPSSAVRCEDVVRAVSLFSGIGCVEVGFQRAGIQTVLQAEQDQWCLSVLARHWPETERVTDVRVVAADQSDKRVGAGLVERRYGHIGRGSSASGVDLIYGGFPCQDVSVAGKRAGLSGDRSGLWSEFHRVLRELRPRWTVIENVPGLLSSNSGRDFATILLGLGELGYGWAYRILDARWFGVPQRRRRVFIVGCLGDSARAAQVLAVCESCGGHPQARPETGQGVAHSLSASVRGIGDGNAWNATYVTPEPDARAVRARASGYRMDGETENFLVAGALRASDGHHGHSSPRGDGADNLIAFHATQEPITFTECSPALGGNAYVGVTAWDDRNQAALDDTHHTLRGAGLQRSDVMSTAMGVRRLTPLECERLMGLPDFHTRWTADGREIPDSHRYRMCGNGVVATVAEWIGHRLVAVDHMQGGDE